MQSVANGLGMFREFAQRLAPYLMLEMLLPGGTLIALLLFMFQRRLRRSDREAVNCPVPRPASAAWARGARTCR